MTFVEHVHCSRCGKRCSGVDPELGLVVRAWVECPECIEKSEGNFSKSEGNSLPIPPRLHAAIQAVIRETRGFNERKQEAWCRVCRDKDEHRLHDPNCCIYELHGAWEEAIDGHQWVRDDPRWPSLSGVVFCAVCGVVRRGDGRNKRCSGVTPRIVLRQEAASPPSAAAVREDVASPIVTTRDQESS